MNKSFTYLKHQYKDANGINYKDIDMNEFNEWLEKQQNNGEIYASFLYSLGLDITDSRNAEINKCSLDSIVLPYQTSIISPYIEDIDRENTYNGELIIKGNTPYHHQYNSKIFRFITQNPYYNFKRRDYIDFKNLHEYTKYDIAIGVFGNIYDKDRDSKIKMLEEFKKFLTVDYISEYDIFDDTYHYVIASVPKKKIKKY